MLNRVAPIEPAALRQARLQMARSPLSRLFRRWPAPLPFVAPAETSPGLDELPPAAAAIIASIATLDGASIARLAESYRQATGEPVRWRALRYAVATAERERPERLAVAYAALERALASSPLRLNGLDDLGLDTAGAALDAWLALRDAVAAAVHGEDLPAAFTEQLRAPYALAAA